MKKTDKLQLSLWQRLSLSDELEYFIENIAILLSSGTDIVSSLRAIKEGTDSSGLKLILDSLREDIEAGSSLSEAFEKIDFLPAYMVSLVKLGEQSGRLTENLQVAVEQAKKERVFKSRLQSALLYPSLILSLTVIIGTGIAWFILPNLATVFIQLDLELPLVTRILIFIGLFLSRYGIFILPLLLVSLFLDMYVLFFAPQTKWIGQSITLLIPGVKKLVLEIEVGRFGYVLGSLLTSGLSITTALVLLSETTEFHQYKKFYVYLKERISEGISVQKSFTGYPNLRQLIPRTTQQTIFTAEHSGNLPQTLLTIGELYENRADITTKNLAILLEPLLLIVVWLGVMFIALAIILPIYNLIGSFN